MSGRAVARDRFARTLTPGGSADQSRQRTTSRSGATEDRREQHPLRRHSTLRFAPPSVETERRADGSILLRSGVALRPHAPTVGHWLARWAEERPDQTFLAERDGDTWRSISYAETWEAVRRVAQGLLARGQAADRPVAILSDNSVDHALLALGAMHVGIPVAPISPAYSLQSHDHAKLKAIFALLKPGLVFAQEPERFAPALAAVGAEATPLAALMTERAGARVDAAFAATGPDTVAKILFTSGSTGTPKGVMNTQRMLCSNRESWAQLWPFLETMPLVLCDWLPWNHTFGANCNFNMVLRHGGTLYIDGGKPTAVGVATTVRNLREIAPTFFLNVPRGFDLLLPFLETDDALRRTFFSRLRAVFYAGAALPRNLWDRLEALAERETGGDLALLAGWGSTETAPMATLVHFHADRPGLIGNPGPGTELKLVPGGGKLEVRVRGPGVTPGYYGRDDLTREAFDEEGFYRIGDAVTFADPADPARGLVFDGRVAEDFKLTSGTWVSTGALRVAVIAACDPLVQDAVITGHDRAEIGALLFVTPAFHDAPDGRARLRSALRRMRAGGGGSSMTPARFAILDEPPSIDAGELTDKGYINQRATLSRRAAQVEALYRGGEDVILP
jgi:feruloyl-CoA synthase